MMKWLNIEINFLDLNNLKNNISLYYMNQINELRNLTILNSKRITNLEKTISNLYDKTNENKNLLNIIQELNYNENKLDDYCKLDYLNEIFIDNSNTIEDFILDTDSIEYENIIPTYFFNN